jgi:tetratricopeptide (TPR) repeat protein
LKFLVFPEGSLDIMRDGERLSAELGDQRSLASFYSEIGFYYSYKGDPPRGVEYSRRAFEVSWEARDVGLMAPAAFSLCNSYLVTGEFKRAVETASKATDLLEETGTRGEMFGLAFNPYCGLLGLWGIALAWLGEFDEAEALCEKGLGFASEIGEFYSLIPLETGRAVTSITKGDGNSAIERWQSVLSYCEQVGSQAMVGLAQAAIGLGYYFLDDPLTARDLAQQGLQTRTREEIASYVSRAHQYLAAFDLALGEMESARAHAEKALELAQTYSEKHDEGNSLMILGRVQGKGDLSQSREAEERILKGLSISDELGTRPQSGIGYFYLGELYADTGQKEKALETLKKAESAFKEMGMDYYLRKTQEGLERLQA